MSTAHVVGWPSLCDGRSDQGIKKQSEDMSFYVLAF